MKDMGGCTLLSRSDVIRAWNEDVDGLLNAIENSFLSLSNDEIICPEKTSMILDENTQSRINCMPSAAPNLDVAGAKFVSVFPDNPHAFGVPNVGGLMVIIETKTGKPTCVMDATALTAIRTAGVDTLVARKMAKDSASVLGVVGTGEQAFYHVLMLCRAIPGIESVRISGRNTNHAEQLVKRLENSGIASESCDSDYAKAVSGADIVVTAISGQEPVLKADWIGAGALYLHVGGWEDEYAVPQKADKIICDCWDSIKHRGSPTIARMFSEGYLADSDIYCNLDELLTGVRQGRESDDEIIYFNSIGLGFVDLLVAEWLYERAVDIKLGYPYSFHA